MRGYERVRVDYETEFCGEGGEGEWLLGLMMMGSGGDGGGGSCRGMLCRDVGVRRHIFGGWWVDWEMLLFLTERAEGIVNLWC